MILYTFKIYVCQHIDVHINNSKAGKPQFRVLGFSVNKLLVFCNKSSVIMQFFMIFHGNIRYF